MASPFLWGLRVPAALRALAPVNLFYKDFPICQAMGIHNLTAKLQVI